MDKLFEKIIEIVGLNKLIFTTISGMLSVLGIYLGGLFNIIPLIVITLCLLIIQKSLYRSKGSNADNSYWEISKELVDSLLPKFQQIMIERGYSKYDYKKETHDCDDYAHAGIVILHELLQDERKNGNIPESIGKADPIFMFSFQRDDGPRHRLVCIPTKSGRVYIDNWVINGSIHRKLSKNEEANGIILS